MGSVEVFVEILRPCWHGGVQYGVGSVIKMQERDANMSIGLKRGKIVSSKSEKLVPNVRESTSVAAKVEAKK
jgi:hypothetical protein